MSNRRIPIDVFTKRQQTLIAESLREVSRALSFSDVVRNYIERVMGRRELGDLLGEVCIIAGDESIPRRRHDLVTTRGTTHVYFNVHIRGVVSCRYSMDGGLTNVGFRVEPPDEDDYFVLGARVLSSSAIDLGNNAVARRARRVERALKDQWGVAKQLELLRLIIDESRRSAGCGLVIAVMDGSIIPWELNMDVVPGSKFFSGLPDDLRDKMLDTEKKLFQGFHELYNDVYNSGNTILVGAVKRSKDWTLQAMANVVPSSEYPDQVRLAEVMGEGTVLRSPIVHYRFRDFTEKLGVFGIDHVDYVVRTYYVRRDMATYPLKLEVLYPKALPEGVREAIPHLLAYLTVASDKHTYIAAKAGGDTLSVPTLKPILVIDKEVSERGAAESARAAYELDKYWERIKDELVECAYSSREGECVRSRRDVRKLMGGGHG